MRLAVVASETPEAQAAQREMEARYDCVAPQEAAVIVALGGDGFMLETLHRFMGKGTAIYGMNCGTIGFLMNAMSMDDLEQRITVAEKVILHPLVMHVRTHAGQKVSALAINEVALFRETRQAAKLKIKVDGVERLEELVCDGVLVATPAGSTAYNLSAHGPIIPLGSPLQALTPISAFRPRRWRGALLPQSAEVTLEVMEIEKRPVSATADFTEIRDVAEVTIHQDCSHELVLLFDHEHNLEERILKEQFVP